MKKLVELKTIVSGFDGKPLGGGPPTLIKELLLTYCSMFVSNNKADVFMAINVGQKIFNCKTDTLDLEDAEYKFLEKAIAEPKHIAIAMASIYKSMGVKLE